MSVPRFRIDRELGSGTSGRVYHAVLTEGFGVYPAGFQLAVKYLHAELEQDPAARARFEAEALAGAAVAHPGIVHVLYAGRDAKGRFLLMPFVPGSSLREVLEREGGALPEPLVRGIARQIAGGLAALHAQGFVHGDIKPENMRLDAEGNAVLLDLGFATRTEVESARGVAPRPGSLPYLAPEQARGELGSPASDVFGLGVVLYELASGAHPFARQDRDDAWPRAHAHPLLAGAGSSVQIGRTALAKPDADRLIAAIVTARFAPPSRLVPQLSPFLDRVLQDALQRDPVRRPTSAEVFQRFVEQERGAWWRSAVQFEANARRGGSGEIDARHLTPLVGRDTELAALDEAFGAAVSRRDPPAKQGAVVWVRGAAGSGKSRLVNEFAARARTSDDPPLYLYGRCRELDEERPCEGILRMLERWLRLPSGVAPHKREIEELEKLVPPRVAHSLGQALDPTAGGTTAISIPLALSTWLAALGRRVPLILFLDDVNWAGIDTLSVLSLLDEHLSGARILLVLGMREGVTPKAPAALEQVKERLATHMQAREVHLEPLSETAVEDLVAALFHHSAPRLRLANVLWQRSRGNPGMVSELVRDLIARGKARAHPEGGGLELSISPDDLPLPGSLQKAIVESYKRLPAADRSWLRRLAVVGGRIETDFLLDAFPDAKRADVDAMLARLSRSGWLAPSGARFRFTRPALREALYRGLSKDQLQKLHAAAAAALAPRDGRLETLEDAFQRAFHLRSAGAHAELAALTSPLLARLARSGQPQRVHPLTQWGLEAIEKLPRSKEHDKLRIELLEAAVDAADRLGIREDQRQLLDRLTDLEFDPDTDPESVGRVYLLHGRYAVSTGQYGLARGMLRNAVDMFARAGADLEESEALRRLAAVQSHVGELADARALAQKALERSVNDAQRALANLALGVIDVLDDRVDEAMANADRAQQFLRADTSYNMPGAFAAIHLLRARIYRTSGEPARALASANRAVRLSRIAGERRLEAEAMARLGGFLLDVDRVEDAEARLREALLLTEEIEDRRGQALARTFLGILLWEMNDPEASSMLAQAVSLSVELGLSRLEAVAVAIRARVQRERGELEEALRASQHALELCERYGAELSDRIVIVGTRALVLASTGARRDSDELERKLRERLKRENARIRSPLARLRQARAAQRLIEAVLSPEGPIYPRVRLETVEPEA